MRDRTAEVKLDREGYGQQVAPLERHGIGVSGVQMTIHALYIDSLARGPPEPVDRSDAIKGSIERLAPHVSGHAVRRHYGRGRRRARRGRGDRIFTVQIGDWKRTRAHADRRNLRDPLVAMSRATRRAGYRGAYILEIFSSQSSPHSLCADFRATLERNARAFDELFRASAEP